MYFVGLHGLQSLFSVKGFVQGIVRIGQVYFQSVYNIFFVVADEYAGHMCSPFPCDAIICSLPVKKKQVN